MLTPVERVLILKSAELLRDVGPRHLLRLADVAREIEVARGNPIYDEQDAADALYMVVGGRVRLSHQGTVTSEVGPGEAFGTWALVDDAERGHRAECVEDGLLLALRREDFYEVAAADLALLQQVVRVMAKRLRELAAERPAQEARVESEGVAPPPAEATTVPATVAGAASGSLAAVIVGDAAAVVREPTVLVSPEPAVEAIPAEPLPGEPAPSTDSATATPEAGVPPNQSGRRATKAQF